MHTHALSLTLPHLSCYICFTYTAALGSFVVSHHSACFLISCFTFLGSLPPMKSWFQIQNNDKGSVKTRDCGFPFLSSHCHSFGKYSVFLFLLLTKSIVTTSIGLCKSHNQIRNNKTYFADSYVRLKIFIKLYYLCIFELSEVCEHFHGLFIISSFLVQLPSFMKFALKEKIF